jgi:uncharacterized protein (TIGR02284 family)
MERNEKLIEILNDLILINNDRVEGYKKAAEESRDIDADLRAIFQRMAEESRKNTIDLTQEVIKYGGNPETGTTASGKLYRAWMDVKATFSGRDRHSLLAACEFGEDAAQKAYRDALESSGAMPADTQRLIVNQQAALKTSHDLMKKYRDLHAAVK